MYRNPRAAMQRDAAYNSFIIRTVLLAMSDRVKFSTHKLKL